MPTQASRHGLRVHYTRSAPKTFPSLLFLTGVVLKLSLFLTGVVLKLSLFLTGRSRTRPLRTPPLLLSALLANATLPPATPPSTSIRMIDIFKPCQDPYRQRLQASPLKRLGNVFHQGESMQSLVSYESSSAESEESSPRKKKLKQIAHEESEVSSSVVEGDLNAESIESSATKLLEMGCSFEQVAHAISVCGNNTPVADVFDFIQAQQYHIGDEGCASNFPAPEEDLEIQLREIGFSQEHIAEALEACGKKSSIFEITDYIQARYCSEDPSCSKSSKSNEVRSSGSGDEDGDGATPLQRLQRMGFTLAAVQRASDECNSIDFDDLLEYLVDAKEEDLPTQERVHYEADSSEDEDDDELTSFQKLQRLGFSSASIQKAIETRESLDFEVLLSFLSEDENVNLLPKADSQVEEDGQKHWAHGKHPSIGLVRKMPTNTDEAGSSRNVSSTVKWTEDQVKLWYTYLGTKKKSNHFSESDVSDNETQQLAWEEKSALKVKKGSRKINFLQSQREDIFKPLQQSKMMGFGIPGHFIGRPRPVPNLMQGPPYFYFENVASVPKSEWDTIKRHLNGVDPEFTDSKFFSASRRPRGYVHNLPVEGRKLILPTPPMTVFEALPDTRKYWPSWDTREKLNCINTRRASETLCGFIRKFFTDYEGMEIPYDRQQEILQACKKWNLVWVGPGQTAPLEPHEIELLLGFDRDHSRGCSTMSDRYDALGNSFQVNTVAYHLSPLKSLYPHGITVLSLFSGIGGAEVALHKLGIFLKTVIAVEINIKTRNVLVSWWKKSGQRGELKLKNDVRELTNEVLAGIIDEVGRIDLIIGGSPCNNLSGNNRVSRVGLSGKESSLFFEFPRILSIVKQIMHERGYM